MANIDDSIDEIQETQNTVMYVFNVTKKMNNLQRNYYELKKQDLIAQLDLIDVETKLNAMTKGNVEKGIEICDKIIKLYVGCENTFDYSLRIQIDTLRTELTNTLNKNTSSNHRQMMEYIQNIQNKLQSIDELSEKKLKEINDFQKKVRPTLPQEVVQCSDELDDVELAKKYTKDDETNK